MKNNFLTNFVKITAAPLLCVGLLTFASTANAQTDLNSIQVSSSTRGSTKVQSRLFNPFAFLQASRLGTSPFGLPAGVETYRANASTLFDPFSSTNASQSGNTAASNSETTQSSSSTSPVTVTPIVGGQSSPSVSAASSSFPFGPRPVRSPYRPQPRGPFGP